jgi:hypothetical protein
MEQGDEVSHIPTEVWEHVALYCTTHDICHQVALLSIEINALFNKENDSFWTTLMQRENFVLVEGESPYKQYSENCFPYYPYTIGVHPNPTSTETRKVVFIGKPYRRLAVKTTQWIRVRFSQFNNIIGWFFPRR